jgi:hypothetical protein
MVEQAEAEVFLILVRQEERITLVVGIIHQEAQEYVVVVDQIIQEEAQD